MKISKQTTTTLSLILSYANQSIKQILLPSSINGIKKTDGFPNKLNETVNEITNKMTRSMQ